MSLLSNIVPYILLFLTISGDVRSTKDPSLSEFGKKALNNFPNNALNRLFNVNFKDKDDFVKTLKKGGDALAEVYGVPLPDKFTKGARDLAKSLGPNISPEAFFAFFANAVSDALQENGTLTEENIDELAKKYASILKDASDSLQSDDFSETEPAIASAIGKFLKPLITPTEEKLYQFLTKAEAEGKKDLE